MQNLSSLLAAAVLSLLISCQQADHAGVAADARKPSAETNTQPVVSSNADANKDFEVDPRGLLKDFGSWYAYTYRNIRLAQDFIGLDVNAKSLNKARFLDQLATGKFAPFRTRLQNNVPVYQLVKFEQPDEQKQDIIRQMAAIEQDHFRMEGTELPAYSFTDLDGKQYTPATTKGKVTVLKCWFIGCTACVKEFPDLNELVEAYKGRSDIQFVSLATDPPAKLAAFLTKHPFQYVVVGDKEAYLKKLGINAFPTHLLLDRTGKIVKVTNSIEDMQPFIAKQMSQAAAI